MRVGQARALVALLNAQGIPCFLSDGSVGVGVGVEMQYKGIEGNRVLLLGLVIAAYNI